MRHPLPAISVPTSLSTHMCSSRADCAVSALTLAATRWKTASRGCRDSFSRQTVRSPLPECIRYRDQSTRCGQCRRSQTAGHRTDHQENQGQQSDQRCAVPRQIQALRCIQGAVRERLFRIRSAVERNVLDRDHVAARCVVAYRGLRQFGDALDLVRSPGHPRSRSTMTSGRFDDR